MEIWRTVFSLGNVFQKNNTMQVNLFFDWLSNSELLTLKTGPPCIHKSDIFSTLRIKKTKWTEVVKLPLYQLKKICTLNTKVKKTAYYLQKIVVNIFAEVNIR